MAIAYHKRCHFRRQGGECPNYLQKARHPIPFFTITTLNDVQCKSPTVFSAINARV
eukprot:COSAG02_NODE_135_length_34565_cov_80.368856_3_plen_56_part_00